MNPSPEDVQAAISKVFSELNKVLVGKREAMHLLMAALLSEGHILVEGIPGTAKTLMAKAFALALGGTFKRVQFTPDTMPSDITGFYIYTVTGRSRFVKGPIFTNILLADELNRAPPRTQAALIEAMQERTVTIEGETMELPKPFIVLATQVPYGSAGTYMLPELQLDRFMFRLWSGYNPMDVERKVVKKIDFIDTLPVERVAEPNVILGGIEFVKKVTVSDDIVSYILQIVDAVRRDENVSMGPSTRGVISLYKGGRAIAFLDGRDYVIPDDVKMIAHSTLDHRIVLRSEAVVDGVKPSDVVDKALKEVPVPK